MSDQSSKCDQTTLPGMTSATSSQGSAAGRSLCISPPGPRIIPSGQARALVSPSHRPASGSVLMIRATSGLFGGGSSASADLQFSLANRLRARMAGYGSLEYALTWKRWGMRSGLPICALRASAPRTCASVSIGLPKGLSMAEGLKGWSTPQAMEPDADYRPSRAATGRTTEYLGRQVRLTGQAKLAGLTSTSSGAPTELTGALNPEFCRWLQGFPTGWARLPDTGTR